jgi:hypothetical protein
MIKVYNNFEKQDVISELKLMLEKLQLSVQSLLSIEVGVNISIKASAFDLVLTADFNDEEGLDEYRIHPEHVKVLDFLKIIMEKAVVVDYII